MSKPKIDTFSDDGIEIMTLVFEILESYHYRMKISRASPYENPSEKRKASYAKDRRKAKLDLLEFISSGDRIKNIPDCYHEAYKDYIVDMFETM